MTDQHFGSLDMSANHLSIETHTGGNINACDQCDFASFDPGNLKTHLKMHSGEKVKKNASNVTMRSVIINANALKTHLFQYISLAWCD